MKQTHLRKHGFNHFTRFEQIDIISDVDLDPVDNRLLQIAGAEAVRAARRATGELVGREPRTGVWAQAVRGGGMTPDCCSAPRDRCHSGVRTRAFAVNLHDSLRASVPSTSHRPTPGTSLAAAAVLGRERRRQIGAGARQRHQRRAARGQSRPVAAAARAAAGAAVLAARGSIGAAIPSAPIEIHLFSGFFFAAAFLGHWAESVRAFCSNVSMRAITSGWRSAIFFSSLRSFARS